MKKTLGACTVAFAILLFNININTVEAAIYKHELGGFEVQPAGDNLIVTNDIFITSDPQFGSHSISLIPKAMIDKSATINFTSEKFNTDLVKIAAILKKDKKNQSFIDNAEFNYLQTPQNDFQDKIAKLLKHKTTDIKLKQKYQVTTLNQLPALQIHAETPVEYAINSTKAYTKEDQELIKTTNPFINFSDDGKTMSAAYTIISDSYLLSVNNNLYNVSSSYIKYPKIKKVKVKNSKNTTTLDNFYSNFSNHTIDQKQFKSISEDFRNSIKFFPQVATPQLSISDRVFNQDFNIPSDWLYVQTSQSIENIPVTFFVALSKNSLEKVMEEVVSEDSFNLSQNAEKLKIDILQPLNTINPDILGRVFKQGVFGVSAYYNDPKLKSNQLTDLLIYPEFTKAIFDTNLEKFVNRELNANGPASKYIKLEKFNYNMQINRLNCMTDFSYQAILNLPQGQENTNDHKTFVNLNGESKVYFDKNGKINLLSYFRTNNQEINSIINESMNNFLKFNE